MNVQKNVTLLFEKAVQSIETAFLSDDTNNNNNDEKCSDERKMLIDKFLGMCQPHDLMYLHRRLDEYKKDFVCCLPVEIVELIFNQLDLTSLLNCCQVKKYFKLLLTRINELF